MNSTCILFYYADYVLAKCFLYAGEVRGQTAITAGLHIILHHRNTTEKDAE